MVSDLIPSLSPRNFPMSSHLRLIKSSEIRPEDRVAACILREFGPAFAEKRVYYWLYRILRYRLTQRRR